MASTITLHRMIMSVFLRDSHFLAMLKRPIWKGLRVTPSCQPNEALGPTVHKNMNAANNHMSLKADPVPVKPQMRAQPWPTS